MTSILGIAFLIHEPTEESAAGRRLKYFRIVWKSGTVQHTRRRPEPPEGASELAGVLTLEAPPLTAAGRRLPLEEAIVFLIRGSTVCVG